MKTQSTTHPEELFLAYLEGALSMEEKMIVEEHLKECGDCRAMLEELRQLCGALEGNRESIFCPEPWELYELAAQGIEPADGLAEHLKQCPECARELEGYRTTAQAEPISPQVTDAFKVFTARQQAPQVPLEGKGLGARLASFFGRLLHAPMLPLASVAAAAVVAVILLYPSQRIEPMLGFSDVQWRVARTGPKGTPKSLVAVEKQRVAILLLFEGLREKPSQEFIDSLYRELQPPGELCGRLEFVDPPRVKASISTIQFDPDNHKTVLDRLARDLHVSRALIVSVAVQKNAYRISGQLVDTKTGKSLEQTVISDVKDSALAETVKDSAISLLSSDKK